ncbi:MAG: cytochrome c [Bacteroidota bacterium]
MNSSRISILLLLFIGFVSCQNKPEEIVEGEVTFVIDPNIATLPMEFELSDLNAMVKDTTVNISYDFVFKKPMTFKGFSINQVFDQLNIVGNEKDDKIEVTFVCKDGYAPSILLSDLRGHEGYVTIQNEGELNMWPDSMRKNISPYYLTWQNENENSKLIYPYGAVSIKIDYADNNYVASYPEALHDNEQFTAGFQLFKEKCIKCHSMNLEGGILGPELNFPKNITEYREKAYMYEFISNPQSFRYNSKMSAVKLTDEEFDLVYNYIATMKEHKISKEKI